MKSGYFVSVGPIYWHELLWPGFNVVCLAVQVVLRDKSVGFEQVSDILAELFCKVMLQLYPSSNMFNMLRSLTWEEDSRECIPSCRKSITE